MRVEEVKPGFKYGLTLKTFGLVLLPLCPITPGDTVTIGRMNSQAWDKLSGPFPPGQVQWRIKVLSKDKQRALVVPYVDTRTVLDRLDEAVGPEGWQDSYRVLLAEGDSYAVVCRLSLLEVSKEDVGEGDSLKAAFSNALGGAALKFGIGRYMYGLEQWVDYDPDTGCFKAPAMGGQESLGVRHSTPLPEESPPSGTPGSQSREPAKPEPLELIDRLMERLKEAGLGKQAALVITRYGGYGKTPDEIRRVYGELRALLKGQM